MHIILNLQFLNQIVKRYLTLIRTILINSYLRRDCDFIIRRSRPNFGISRLPRPKRTFSDRRDQNLVFPDFADRSNVSATSATKGKLTATSGTEGKLVAAVENLAAAVEKLIEAWSKN